jgi:probable F420-dependent oxidoreductase
VSTRIGTAQVEAAQVEAAQIDAAQIDAALPYWLDRPDEEALDIAVEARNAGIGTLWVGEMIAYDAFALATAIGHRTPGLGLKVGPLAIGVRSPASTALGIASVAALTGSSVGVALGASSPTIVSGWHGREWAHGAARMRETVECLRPILAGDRSSYAGRHVRSCGFRLRGARPATRITVAAFSPMMTRVAAQCADEAVMNLVAPERVRKMRAAIDAAAAAAGRVPPRLAVWVPVALEPGAAALAQMAAQLAVYLAPPGYGEMFAELGFGALVQRARDGAGRLELARAIPNELLEQVCALGSPDSLAQRIDAYHDAGADTVAVVPSTAEDPGGRAVLSAVTKGRRQPLAPARADRLQADGDS